MRHQSDSISYYIIILCCLCDTMNSTSSKSEWRQRTKWNGKNIRFNTFWILAITNNSFCARTDRRYMHRINHRPNMTSTNYLKCNRQISKMTIIYTHSHHTQNRTPTDRQMGSKENNLLQNHLNIALFLTARYKSIVRWWNINSSIWKIDTSFYMYLKKKTKTLAIWHKNSTFSFVHSNRQKHMQTSASSSLITFKSEIWA